jgi:hypothetical protein
MPLASSALATTTRSPSRAASQQAEIMPLASSAKAMTTRSPSRAA